MTIFEALRQKKTAIVADWVERTLDSYVAPGHFKQSRDRFANPVGANTSEALARLFDLLCGEDESPDCAEPLDQLLRIRSVQEISPSQAVAPVLELKWVVRRLLAKDKAGASLLPELHLFDLRVEKAALAAFDVYVACRERLFQVRLDEFKSGRHLLAGAVCPSSLARRQGEGDTRQTM